MGAHVDDQTLWKSFLEDYQKLDENESQSFVDGREKSESGSSDEQSGKKIITLLMSL